MDKRFVGEERINDEVFRRNCTGNRISMPSQAASKRNTRLLVRRAGDGYCNIMRINTCMLSTATNGLQVSKTYLNFNSVHYGKFM